MFSFSGFYHALTKFEVDIIDQYFDKSYYQTASTHLNIDSIIKYANKPVTNISLVTIDSSQIANKILFYNFLESQNIDSVCGRDLMFVKFYFIYLRR